MRSLYNKTNWVDNKTPVNAENLNNIENGISNLYANSISLSEILGGSGINVSPEGSNVNISLNFRLIDNAPETPDSDGLSGDFYIDTENGYLFFCISSNPIKWVKLKLENF